MKKAKEAGIDRTEIGWLARVCGGSGSGGGKKIHGR